MFARTTRSLFRLATRSMATEGKKDGLSFTFASPSQSFYKDSKVKQVRVPSYSSSRSGILAGHAPISAVLKPSVVTIEESGDSRNFSVATGTETRNPITECLLRAQSKARQILFYQPQRQFHAAHSKVHYLDFRHRFRTNHLRLHLLIIRRQKMKKHKLKKFRKRFKCLLAKKRLKREIAKEKTFRVELLSMIRSAENFDPKEYALKKIAEINNRPAELTREERLEQLKELIRKNRYQVTYIKPKHRRADL